MNLKSVQGSVHTEPGKQSIGLVELAKTTHVKGLDNPHLPIQKGPVRNWDLPSKR